ncbi:MAG: MATE family efflux transporter [Clostridia bacterium]|nr:MATE family efflux transporter [Clostridia bacterium]
METAALKKHNFTEGAIFSRIIRFALPLIATNLLQILYSTADMVIVGLSSEPDAVGAIGACSSLVHLIVNLFIGFAAGATVIVARHLGAKDEGRVSKTVHTAILMSLVFGIACAAVGTLISRPLLHLMGAEDKLLELADLYTKVYFLGVPFVSVTNYAISILRAKGDTKTPFIVLTAGGLLNVLLNLGFVFLFDMSVDGVALATAISNAASAVVLLIRLAKDKSPCRFSLRRLCFDRTAFGEILHVGLPAGLQSAMFSLSNIIIQSSILQVNNALAPVGSAYQPIVKGAAAATNLENFAFAVSTALHQAALTFTSQNAGADRYDRVRRSFLACSVATVLLGTVATLILFFARTPLLALYGVRNGAVGTLDYLAYDAGYQRLLLHLLPFPLYAFLDTCTGVARGLKKSVTSTLITLVGTCLLRIVWIATVFPTRGTLASIFISYPLSWIVTTAAQLLLVLIVIRKKTKPQKT